MIDYVAIEACVREAHGLLGESFIENPSVAKNVLRDFLPDMPRERKLLEFAIDEDILSVFATIQERRPEEIVLRAEKAKQAMLNTGFLDETVAINVVDSICKAICGYSVVQIPTNGNNTSTTVKGAQNNTPNGMSGAPSALIKGKRQYKPRVSDVIIMVAVASIIAFLLYNFWIKGALEERAAQKAAEVEQTLLLLEEEVYSLLEQGKYDDIWARVSDAESRIGSRAEIESLKEEITEAQVNYYLNEAEIIFGEDKDYQAAIDMISAGISTLGEDSRLVDAIQEYQSYTPVKLVSLDYFDKNDSSITIHEEVQDNVGSTYEDAYSMKALWHTGYVVYYIDGAYSTFSGTIALPYDERDDNSARNYEVYADDVLVYSSGAISAGSYPQDFEIDITGATLLKITSDVDWDDSAALICDGMLQK